MKFLNLITHYAKDKIKTKSKNTVFIRLCFLGILRENLSNLL